MLKVKPLYHVGEMLYGADQYAVYDVTIVEGNKCKFIGHSSLLIGIDAISPIPVVTKQKQTAIDAHDHLRIIHWNYSDQPVRFGVTSMYIYAITETDEPTAQIDIINNTEMRLGKYVDAESFFADNGIKIYDTRDKAINAFNSNDIFDTNKAKEYKYSYAFIKAPNPDKSGRYCLCNTLAQITCMPSPMACPISFHGNE